MPWMILAQQVSNATIEDQNWLNAGLLVMLFGVYAAERLVAHLKTRGIDLQEMRRELKELHEWHNHDHPDQPGVKIWYNQKYVAELIHEMAVLTRKQTVLSEASQRDLREMHVLVGKQTELLRDLTHRYEDMYKQLDALRRDFQ